jgi:hypothetical protein
MIMAHEFSRLQSTYVLVAKKTASRLGTTATWSPGAFYVLLLVRYFAENSLRYAQIGRGDFVPLN